jgi:hypothetical protein
VNNLQSEFVSYFVISIKNVSDCLIFYLTNDSYFYDNFFFCHNFFKLIMFGYSD